MQRDEHRRDHIKRVICERFGGRATLAEIESVTPGFKENIRAEVAGLVADGTLVKSGDWYRPQTLDERIISLYEFAIKRRADAYYSENYLIAQFYMKSREDVIKAIDRLVSAGRLRPVPNVGYALAAKVAPLDVESLAEIAKKALCEAGADIIGATTPAEPHHKAFLISISGNRFILEVSKVSKPENSQGESS